jgi:predicted NAD-dependent protein-ADP-ribosyltransferase YbiA (DUF1768 family)
MRAVLEAKLSRHKYIHATLKRISETELTKDAHDPFLGKGQDSEGENRLVNAGCNCAKISPD